MKWIKFEGDDCHAIVTCSYKPINCNHMELRIGDFVFIKEQYPGWYLGFNYSQPCVLKVFPNSHVRILSSEIHPDLWAEIYSWIPSIRESYLLMDNKEFDQVIEAVQLTITEKRFDSLQERNKVSEANRRSIVSRMVFARKMLSLPLESQNEKGEKIDLKDASILDLYTQHMKVYENNRNSSGQFDKAIENISIFVKILGINFEKDWNTDENLEVVVSLYQLYKIDDKVRVCRLSECFIYKVGQRLNQTDLVKLNAFATKDIQFVPHHRVFLVFQFIRYGLTLPNKKPKEGEMKYRRPHGVAICDITSSIIECQDIKRTFNIQLTQKEESIEAVTEKMIQEYRHMRTDCRNTISVQFKVMRADDCVDRHNIIYGINPYYPPPIRSKRNVLYLNLFKADINKGEKKSDPNIEIDLSIRDEVGNMVSMPIEDWRLINGYKSVIYYHIGKPRWNEMICIPLFENVSKFPPQTHIRFVIWHRSRNSKKTRILGVAFLRLFPNVGSCSIIKNKEHDNAHVLTIHKMEMSGIKISEYLKLDDEVDGTLKKHNLGNSSNSLSNIISRNQKNRSTKDTISIQTLLISNEYSFDDLLANICCNKSIDESILNNLKTAEIKVKNIDPNELKKFAVKILDSGIQLLQRNTEPSYLGRNILILLAEMFKAIKNLPEYQAQINKFISETKFYHVHLQILTELINHIPEIDSSILRASDWFMKIVVVSYQNMEAEFTVNDNDIAIFNEMVDHYLQKLEGWANQKQNKTLRSFVWSKTGTIINALIPVCKPIGMAKLVHDLLATSRDLDAITKAGLTMECMNSELFLDPECRKIILPETTRNILELFGTQLNKVYHGREVDQDHMLDNICEYMVEFMQLHERSWQNECDEMRDLLVYELLFDNNMFRTNIAIVSQGLEFLRREDHCYKVLYKPLMVLISVIITSLRFLSTSLWKRLLSEQIEKCVYCSSKQMTNNFDMVLELISLISLLQTISVFPDSCKGEERKTLSVQVGVIPRQHRVMKQSWLDMMFIQSRQFLTTIGEIHHLIMQPYYLQNIAQMNKIKQRVLCCCHPSEKEQIGLINQCVESIRMIISQPSLKLDALPPSSAIRIMQSSEDCDSDIRLIGALLIQEIWQDLDLLKIEFSPLFFNIFSKLTTIQNYKIRLLAVECMFDIVHLDRDKKKTELITQIDQAMEKSDSGYCEEMSRAMRQMLNNNSLKYAEDIQMVEDIMVQMKNIEECSQHLNDNSPINGMIVINNLRKFYQKMGRSDIIGRYLFKLMTIHQKIKNFTEMGYTLLELSSFYKWSYDIVMNPFFPPEYAKGEFEWQLKAKLLEESLKHFEQEDWEQGIEVCKELVNGYTNFVIDFVKLSEIHKRMSELLRKIMFNDRPESSTYIIFYIGEGFPKFITELPYKSIVLMTKCNAIDLSMNLNAQFKNTTVEKRFPTEGDYEGLDKKIFFMPIKSNKFDIPPKYQGKCVKQRVLKYYESYKIEEFVFKRLINNTEEDPRKRKIEGCVVKCDGSLPNILSVVPVKDLHRESIDPFNEALHDLQLQIRKDEMLYQDYEMASPSHRETMYQKMKDVILKYISPVSGGVAKLVEMIPENDENKLSYAGNVVTQVFALIYQYLECFEIYDNLENYNIFLSEFRKITEAVSFKLDIGEENFNINSLPELFNKSRKVFSSGTTFRKQSVVTRPKHNDESQSTMSRKTRLPKELLNDLVADSRASSMSDDEHTLSVTSRPRSNLSEPGLPQRQSVLDIPGPPHAPPLPPRPRNSIRINSPLTQNIEPPPKPSTSFGNTDNLNEHCSL